MQATISTSAPAAKRRFDLGLVEVFAELADLFGNPRSHGQIYGLLFSSPDPLSMDDITDKIGISKGSASLGLRALEDLGAIERHANGRSALYSARMELKTLVAGFVRQRLMPRLEKSNDNLKELSELLAEMPRAEAKEARWRLKRVAQWHSRATIFLPLAEKILGSKLIETRVHQDENK